ncbi:MAG: DUF4349 domain-containing protein [Candidatus Levybacteria bacterium]|nr:DUF4349 domain-containing protein [Candidatus Levybacteria bacterium]
MGIINWIKTHKALIVLIVIGFFVYNFFQSLLGINTSSFKTPALTSPGYYNAPDTINNSGYPSSAKYQSDYSDSSNRMVVKNSDLSLLVKDVRETANQIISYSQSLGGYMVSSSFSRPEESPFATITVRVPSSSLDQTLNYFRKLAIKVTSENLIGNDITDEYKDIESRLVTFRKTLAKFNDMLDKSTNVQDTLSVQREIITLQDQIDQLIGQKQSMEKNAELSRVTIYLSTDELALPYMPDKVFRPDLTFKQAVRSLVTSLRSFAEKLIWLAVYSVIWGPILIVYLLYRKWSSNRAIKNRSMPNIQQN